METLIAGLLALALGGQGTAIPAADARRYLGKTKLVCGNVTAVRPVGGNDALDLDGVDPNQALTILVPRPEGFSGEARARAMGVRVCVSGRIEKGAHADAPPVIRIKDLTTLRSERFEVARPEGFAGSTVVDLTAGRHPPGVSNPRILLNVEPRYTSVAMRAKVQGDVEIEGIVLADGTIGPLRVLRSLDSLYGLDEQAMVAIRKWKFAPALRNGEPVACIVTVVMSFRLH